MNREQLIEAEIFKIESVHHFHGDTCLCGFSSARSRSRTEHITGLVRAVFEQAHVKPFDTSPERAKTGGDSSHVTASGEPGWGDGERHADCYYGDHHVDHHDDEREALIDVMVMTKLSDYAATDMSTIHQAVDAILAAGFRRTVQGEPANAPHPEKSDIPGGAMSLSVQGEPSDAQVLAALNAYYGGKYPVSDAFKESMTPNMSAALRAAAATPSEER